MHKLLFIFAAVLLAVMPLAAQDAIWNILDPARIYVAYREATLVAAAEVVTLQQPAAAASTVHLDGVAVYCSVGCSFAIERNGVAATATALVPIALNPGLAAKTKAFRSSDVGAGAVLGRYDVAAGTTLTVPLRGLKLKSTGGTGENLTVRTNSITGDVRVIIRFGEIL